jgi:hypothetical protein
MTLRRTVTIRVVISRARTRSSVSSPHLIPLSMSVSTSSLVSASGSDEYSRSKRSGVTIVRTVAGTDGMRTPWHGWIEITWSFSAVVKIELRMDVLQYWITQGEALRDSIQVIHSRMCSGRTCPIRIEPKNGRMCLSR